MPGTRKLGKPTDQRRAMLRQMVTDFLDKGRMETTVTRAKEIRPIAEKMITLGKRNTLASRRRALAFITREDVVTKIFNELATTYAARRGGYCRIIRIGPRRGDGAEMAVIELVEGEVRAAAPKAKPTPVRTTRKPTAKPKAEEANVEAVEAEAEAPEPEAETVPEAETPAEPEAEAIEVETPAESEAEAVEVETPAEPEAEAPAEPETPKAEA